MIGNSFPEYLFIRTSITALRLVAPTSILYLALSVWNAAFPISPLLGAVAVAEAGFFLAFYLPRTRRLQAVCVAFFLLFPLSNFLVSQIRNIFQSLRQILHLH